MTDVWHVAMQFAMHIENYLIRKGRVWWPFAPVACGVYIFGWLVWRECFGNLPGRAEDGRRILAAQRRATTDWDYEGISEDEYMSRFDH